MVEGRVVPAREGAEPERGALMLRVMESLGRSAQSARTAPRGAKLILLLAAGIVG